jgi:protein-S-isoprenylcysteine O-methyltransferase Ste14
MTESMLWQIVLGTWCVSEVLILVITRTRRSKGKVSDRGSLQLLWFVIFGSISLRTWIGETHRQTMFGGAHWVRPVSLGILVAGLMVRWTAIWTLGRAFSANVAIRTDQRVQKTGIFSYVRHPSYTGLLIIFVAIGAHTRNWVGLAAVVVPTTLALLYRIYVEEAALGQAFGQEYVEYSRTTKRLVPGIY